MDYTKPLIYRGVNLNSAAVDPTAELAAARAGRIVGLQVTDFVVGSVRGIGYSEKRANADGRDASDIFLDGRQMTVVGTLYGETAADAHDRFQELCSVCSPTGAFTASPGTYGYLPLSWYEPTDDPRYTADDDGLRWRPLFVNARPLIVPERRWSRDATGGDPARGFGVPYQAFFDCVDPRIYVDPAVTVTTVGAGPFGGNFVHKGDYPSPLNALFVVGANAGSTKLITVTAGGSIMKITVPISAVEQVFRYNGALKVLTVTPDGGLEALRRDLLAFETEVEHPLIPPTSVAEADEAPYAVTSTITLLTGSRLWFHEAYA